MSAALAEAREKSKEARARGSRYGFGDGTIDPMDIDEPRRGGGVVGGLEGKGRKLKYVLSTHGD